MTERKKRSQRVCHPEVTNANYKVLHASAGDRSRVDDDKQRIAKAAVLKFETTFVLAPLKVWQKVFVTWLDLTWEQRLASFQAAEAEWKEDQSGWLEGLALGKCGGKYGRPGTTRRKGTKANAYNGEHAALTL